MKFIKTFALIFTATLFLTSAKAEFIKAELQVSGLTCSMCQLATEKSLKTLDFVSSIKPDLNRNVYVLTFKKDKTVNLDLIKKKVKDAGFSVSKLVTVFNFENVKIKNDSHFEFAGSNYHFINVAPKTLNGEVKVTVIDNGFASTSEVKKYSALTSLGCYKTGVMGKARVYHLTI